MRLYCSPVSQHVNQVLSKGMGCGKNRYFEHCQRKCDIFCETFEFSFILSHVQTKGQKWWLICSQPEKFTDAFFYDVFGYKVSQDTQLYGHISLLLIIDWLGGDQNMKILNKLVIIQKYLQ